MNNPTPNSAALLFQPLACRASALLGQLWRTLVEAPCTLRPMAGEVDRDALEREATAGLSEHLLKDIGASPGLIAKAALRCRDDVWTGMDRGLY